MDYFYDSQIRRYLVQFMRIFSEIKHMAGPDRNGNYAVERIPIMYGDPSMVVAQLLRGGSQNTAIPTPMFSAYITDLRHVPERRQSPQHVSTASVLEREFKDGMYTDKPGVRVDVQRYMPVPYDIYMQLDFWAPNVNTKLQVLEQILTIFNPSIQLQQNASVVDWTSIFEVFIEDVTWTSRSVPVGTEDTKDVASLRFKVQAWINPPSLVKRTSLITQIVANIHDMSGSIDTLTDRLGNHYDIFDSIDPASYQMITTVGGHAVDVFRDENGGDYIRLLGPNASETTQTWAALFDVYGQVVPKITKMRLKLGDNLDDDTHDVIGFIELTEDAQVLRFTVDEDTIPGVRRNSIDDIIDPTEVWPGQCLPPARIGQRYLITSQYSALEEPAIPRNVPTSPWGSTIDAVYSNDIIEFDGTRWVRSFNSIDEMGEVRVVNKSNNTYYTFKDGHWRYTYHGKYHGGFWRVDNIQKKK